MKTIKRMYEHIQWANKRIFEQLQVAELENKESIRLFSHILFAEKVWITRMLGLDSTELPLWENVDLKACLLISMENEKNLKTLLEDLTEEGLDKQVSYKNSKGMKFHNSFRDILTHVALHGQYHRGQINQKLREQGIEPVIVDYIAFLR